MKRFAFLIFFFALLFTGTANAQGEASLKLVMTNLEADMEAIVRALNYGDFETIEARALAIANHEKPPMTQRKKIMNFLGEEMVGFKKGDAKVHDSALKVAEYAAEKDYAGVIEGYGVLLGGCVACHTTYRSRIIEHLKER
jgi:cytochrome c556